MFKIDIKFKEQLPPRASYSDMSIDEVYGCLRWDARLTIIFEDRLLLATEIAIIEFYWYLINWYRRIGAEEKSSFVYSTVEHTEPILVFAPQPNDCWEITSVWLQSDETVLIEEKSFYNAVQKLIEEIELVIEGQGEGSAVP